MLKLSRAQFNAAEEEIRHLKQKVAQCDGRIEKLEAALKFYECGCKQDSCTPEEPKFRSIKCGWIAKAALGEKK
jgi:hypothetical protein